MTTRREVLRGLAGGLGLASLAGCRTTGAEGGGPVQGLPLARAPKEGTVAVLRPSTFPSLREAVAAVIARAGGLGFIRPGERVLIKPAINSEQKYPATTDPEVAFIVAQLVLEAGGEPFIADRTMFARSTALTFHALGLDDAARQAKVSCQPLDHAEVVRVPHVDATHWSGGAVPIYRPVADADHVINLCTPRTHRLGDFTMALKNLVGTVAADARLGMHLPGGFKERLAEISLAVPCSFVLMDGRLGFTDGGPDQGDLARLDFLAASSDPVAIDAVGLGFLRLAGTNQRLARGSPWDLPVMRRAVELGLGVTGAAQLKLVGLAEDDERQLRARLT